MFLNPWYGGEAPQTANGGVLSQTHSSGGLYNKHQSSISPAGTLSPQPSPVAAHRLTTSQTSASPAPSPTLLPRSSHLHTHFSYLNSSPLNSSSTNTTSSSATSSPVLLRASHSPSSSPRISRNFNTFNTPHNLQSSSNNITNISLTAAAALPKSFANANNASPSLCSFSLNDSGSLHESSSSGTNTSSGSSSSPLPSLQSHDEIVENSVTSLKVGRSLTCGRAGAPPLHVLQNLLDELQMKLRPGWTVHCTTDGRYFYCK